MNLAAMSGEDLCRRLTEVRQTVEAIRPYTCRDLTEQYRDLAAELARRRKRAELGIGQGVGAAGAVLPVVWEGEV